MKLIEMPSRAAVASATQATLPATPVANHPDQLTPVQRITSVIAAALHGDKSDTK